MERDLSPLHRALLELVCDDIFPFEQIVDDLSKGPAGSSQFELEKVQRTLLDLISRGLVGSYLLHADAPYITPTEVDFDSMPRYWYCITDKGQKLLRAQQKRSS